MKRKFHQYEVQIEYSVEGETSIQSFLQQHIIATNIGNAVKKVRRMLTAHLKRKSGTTKRVELQYLITPEP